MSLWRSDPDRAADDLILKRLDEIETALPTGAHLLCANTSRMIVEAMQRRGFQSKNWQRRWADWTPAHMLPAIDPATPPQAALVRLPKDKNELGWTLDIVLRALPPGAPVLIYGGNDEGVRSIPKRLTERYGEPVETVTAHGHGRVSLMRRPATLPETAGEIAQTINLGDGVQRRWISNPGVFADGTLDPGTALLLQHLPELQTGATVLDYGCGTGVIARALLDLDPTTKLVLIDNDTAALSAARRNVGAGQHYVLGAGVGVLSDESAPEWRRATQSTPTQFDLIISNPPIHSGIREDHGALDRLIIESPRHLKPGGYLVMVVQRRIALERQLSEAFKTTQVLADDGRFRVWSATVA